MFVFVFAFVFVFICIFVFVFTFVFVSVSVSVFVLSYGQAGQVIALPCSESVTSSGRGIPQRFIARKPNPGSSSSELSHFYFNSVHKSNLCLVQLMGKKRLNVLSLKLFKIGSSSIHSNLDSSYD